MMQSDRRTLRKALQRIFRRRQQKRQLATRRFEIMESRVLLAADLHVALLEPPMLELHGEYSSIETVVPVAEGEGAIAAEGEAAQDLVAFAQALTASGTRFFGAAWCPACTDQKELFEDGGDFLPFIEVTNLDSPVTLNAVGDGTDTTLNPSGVPVTSFPTWEFPDGTRLEGGLTLEVLSQRSGVAIPSSDQPFIAPIDDGDISSTDVDADGDEIVTLLGGSPLHIALDGYDPGGGALTYTVSSSDPGFVAPTLLQNNRSMVIDVAGWGKMNLHLFEQRAPRPTSRLIALADSGDYAGVPLHRIVNGFVIQGGDITNGDGTGGSSLGDFDDQFHVELQHNRTGVLSYAKSSDDTNDSQFFITEGPTRTLDGNHSVAGILVEGEKNREAISNNSTTNPRSVVMNSVDVITDNENAVLMLAATPGATGTSTITVTATDADNNQFTRVFTVNVQPDPSDTLPWLGEVSEIKVPTGQSTTFQFPIIDIEGDDSQIGVVAPTSFTIDAPTGAVTTLADLTITPAAGFVGQESITFFVADADLDLAGVTITDALLQSNSTLFDVQSVVVEAEASSTGTISGTVFGDTDRDGVLDTGESGLGGFVVFSDSNSNGLNDPGEVTATTAANGTYSLELPTGQHTIRQLAVADFLQTTANPVTLDLQSGETIEDVRFGNFDVEAPNTVDLLAVTDSGNDSDNITNFNNSAADRALQFQVGGVVDGATVRLFSDGVLIGQGVANGGITITTDATTTLTDGTHSIIATQEVGGVQGSASVSLTVTIDATAPGAFTSTAPTGAIVDNDISYDAASGDEGNGVTYSLSNAPSGATIDGSTGFLSWVPTAAQLGENNFAIIATDVAGNTTSQPLSVRVTNLPIVGATFKVTSDANPTSPEIGQVTVGDTFFLHVAVTDLRDNALGTFAFYEDIAFDPQLVSAQNITFSPTYPNVRTGTILGGEIDEVGAVNFDSNGVGPGTFDIFSVEFKATRSGTLDLIGNTGDDLPNSDVLVVGVDSAIPANDILFGATQLTINPGFGANDDIFNFDEDSTNITLDVLANDSSLSGSTANLTIDSISPQLDGVSIATDGKSLLYSPAADFNGEITFDYTVTDGVDNLTANVTVQIFPVNDQPIAVDDTAEITAGTSNNFINVLANDTDIDGDQLRVASVGQLSGNGSITVASGGTGLNYTPGTGFVGSDSVTYTITDNHGGTSQATLSLTVTGAGDDLFTVNEESVDNVFDVLQNDTGAGLTITAVGSTSNGGIVTIVDSGTRLNYSRPADDNVFGTDTFTYTTTDSSGKVSTGTVIVTITNTNDAPTAADDSFTVTQGSSGNTLNVLLNDSNAPDPQGETLTVVSVDESNSIGSVTLVNGSVQYSAPATFPATGLSTGTDTFTYTIDDGSGLTSQATATVSVVDFVPGSLSGFVYVDSNNNGIRDASEEGFEGVAISLTGADNFNNPVSLQTTTASDGSYTFDGLAPGSYTLRETQPTGQRNGVPIVDGQDTIGSQGGSVSANDEFTITLAEGTAGGNNNFGELLGRTLAGSVENFRIVETGNRELFGGLNLRVIEDGAVPDSSNQFASTKSAGGTFEVTGVAPGTYQVLVDTPMFLLSNGTAVFTTSVSTEADSTGNEITVRGREAAFITLRDISTAAPTEFAHAAVSASGHEWYSFGRGWEGFTDANFTTTNGGADLRIEVINASGQTLRSNIAKSDARVRILGERDGFELIQIVAGSTAFDLQVVSTGDTNGASGEGSSIGFPSFSPVVATPIATSPVVTTMAANPTTSVSQGESAAIGLGNVQVFQPVVGRPVEAPAPADSPTAATSPTVPQLPVIPADLSTASTGTTVALTSTLESSATNQPTADQLSVATRASLLVEVGNEYGDPFRYGASSGAEFVPLEEELYESTEEAAAIPEELLEELAQDVAAL